MEALNIPEPSLCPANCLFSYIVINQSCLCHFYCAAPGAVMSEDLTLKGVFHSCLWILDPVLWVENSLCTGGHSYPQVLITIGFSSDAGTPQKALLRPLPPQSPQKPTGRPFMERDIVCNQPQTKTKVLDFVLHTCILAWKLLKQTACSRYANSSVILCILFTLPSQKLKYNMKRRSYLRDALWSNWPTLPRKVLRGNL